MNQGCIFDTPVHGKETGDIPLDKVLKTAYINTNEGKGAVFCSPLEPASVVFIDRPLYSYIHHFSRLCALICEACYRPVGSLGDNINHLLQLHNTSLCQEAVSLIESTVANINPSAFIRCPHCNKIYCTHQCMEDSKAVHALFCRQMTCEELEHWSVFQRYCLKTDENLYFVGSIFTKLVAEVVSNRRSLGDIILELSEFYEIPCDTVSWGNGRDYWSKAERLERSLEAFKLLMVTLKRFERIVREQDLHNAEKVFTPAYFLLLLSKVELVAVDIEIENPLNWQLRMLMEDPTIRGTIGKQLIDVKRSLYGLDTTSMELDAWELELPDILGLGIYASLSKLNHSCTPNLEVEYADSNVARVRLLKPVLEDEQATIAYIDEAMTLSNRRKALLENYNFTCYCPKCIEEEQLIMEDEAVDKDI